MVGEILENYLAPFVLRRGLGSDEPFRVGWLVVVRGSRFEVRGSGLFPYSAYTFSCSVAL